MNTGACKYCGQTFMIDIDDKDWADAEGDMDLVATRRCKCEGAMYFRHKEKQAEKTCDNVDMAFLQDKPSIAELLKAAVPYVVNGSITKINVTADKIKASVQMTSKDTVKVTRSDSEVKEFNE